MLNNLTIFLVITTLFVYCGGKNVPKELIKYKLLIVGLTIGLIVCSFFNKKIENFTVSYGEGGNQTNIYSCNEDEEDNSSDNYCSMRNCKHSVRRWTGVNFPPEPPTRDAETGLLTGGGYSKEDARTIKDLYDQCKTTYRSGETHTFKNSGVLDRTNAILADTSRVKDEEWCRNPENIIEGGGCYNCNHVIHGNVPKDPENPYRPNGQCFRCSTAGGQNTWSPTSCPRDPDYCSPMMQSAGLCN